ncbi:MAG TPA: glycerol-3-phosphate dehydrogenase/oxidase [Caldilineae bacterium]|nr:glycerol-3-phosphate dehydrogenase/oxidase [Caldilineae bacterium]
MSTYHSPWPPTWRADAWSRLDERWDIIVIGGGITGAGILALAARMGLRVLLLEQNDFASGTSSRSSKLVHGGLRYLKQMQLRLTRESVKERQRLLEEAPGLVLPMNFVYPVYEGMSPSAWLIDFGLNMYTHMASEAGGYRELEPVDFLMLAPGLTHRHLEQGFLYGDAQTDDARLVLRVLHDGLLASEGRATAINYARVTGLLHAGEQVVGVQIQDKLTGAEGEALAAVVINATGVWADRLRSKTAVQDHLRPLRGSHLFFADARFPVYQAIAMHHPNDGRPVFVYPWEGVTLLGTTDVDYLLPLDAEPGISLAEADYLLRAVQSHFPDLQLTPDDVISTQAGVRPVVDTGKEDPSAEHRDHVIWLEDGLLTVTGGKLTTFRLIARDTLKAAHSASAEIPKPGKNLPALDRCDPTRPLSGLDRDAAPRLWGRYGSAAPALVETSPDLLTPISGTPYLWAELLWSIAHEAIVHLDDLMLRRFRFGILLQDGGQSLLPHLKPAIQQALGWDDAHWSEEVKRYRHIWRQAHGLPEGW